MRNAFVIVREPVDSLRSSFSRVVQELGRMPGQISTAQPDERTMVAWLTADGNDPRSCVTSQGTRFGLCVGQNPLNDSWDAELEIERTRAGNGLLRDGWAVVSIEPNGPIRCLVDQTGQGAVYWAETGGGAVIGSQIRHLLAHGRVSKSINLTTVMHRLAGLDSGLGNTLYSAIGSLRPGHELVYSEDSTEERQWWEWTARLPDFVDPNQAAPLLVGQLERAVDRITTEYGGPRTAVLLSGGLDSSILSGMVSRFASKASAVTLRYPGLPCDESDYQDAVLAANGLRDLAVNHRDLEPIADLIEPMEFSRLPMNRVDPEAIDGMRLASDAGCSQLLDGTGGDELFAPYRLGPGEVLSQLASGDSSGLRPVGLGRSLFRGLVPQFVLADRRRRLLPSYINRDVVGHLSAAALVSRESHLGTSRAQQSDRAISMFATGTREVFREHVERAEMLSGIESRFPFFDVDVALTAFSVRNRCLRSSGDDRAYQRHTFRSLIPEEIRKRRGKVHFDWRHALDLKGPFVDDVLTNMRLEDLGLVTSAVVRSDRRRLLEQLASPGVPLEAMTAGIWRVIGLEVWLHSYGR